MDGHEKLAVELQWRHEDEDAVQTARMPLRYNDEYVASFRVERLGRYRYKVRAWLDAFGTWQDQFRRRVEGGAPQEELATELLDGAALLRRASDQRRRRREEADRRTTSSGSRKATPSPRSRPK